MSSRSNQFALGFALRDAVSNLIAGVLILLYQPFGYGDKITVGGNSGTVTGINFRYTVLKADGGAVVNPFLMQHQSDILGVKIEIPTINETTALGAAYLAGLATGVWSSLEEISEKWSIRNTYLPLMDKNESDSLYKQWLRAVNRSKAWAS